MIAGDPVFATGLDSLVGRLLGQSVSIGVTHAVPLALCEDLANVGVRFADLPSGPFVGGGPFVLIAVGDKCFDLRVLAEDDLSRDRQNTTLAHVWDGVRHVHLS